MIDIIGTELYQWDVGRSVKVTDSEATHVHFANQGDAKAVKIELADSQALIPDYLLQTGKQLCVYAVANGVTIERKIFSVKKRERPEDYVYDEDQRNFIYELIQSTEDAALAAKQAIQDLIAAKERGDFNGPKGEKGDPGDKDAVLYTEQNLSEEQKAQARKNLGITDGGGSGGDNALHVVGTTNDLGEMRVNYTAAEIYERLKDEGNACHVYLSWGSVLYQLARISQHEAVFEELIYCEAEEDMPSRFLLIRWSFGNDYVLHLDEYFIPLDGGSIEAPVRGVDYWTEEDKAEIKSYVDEAILGGAW